MAFLALVYNPTNTRAALPHSTAAKHFYACSVPLGRQSATHLRTAIDTAVAENFFLPDLQAHHGSRRSSDETLLVTVQVAAV